MSNRNSVREGFLDACMWGLVAILAFQEAWLQLKLLGVILAAWHGLLAFAVWCGRRTG